MCTRLVFLCLAAFAVQACGAAQVKPPSDVLGQLDLVRADYAESDATARTKGDAAKAAKAEAERAEKDRVEKALRLAKVLYDAAAVKKAEAAKYEEEMCRMDPSRCVQAQPAPPPVKQASEFVDVRITAFAEGGFARLSAYPSGWQVVFASAKFVLQVNGQDKAQLSDPAAVGKCYRVVPGEFQPIQCPN